MIDSVYMLMFPGWESELRSNRWHFARRWARLHPVVLVQPELTGDRQAIPRPETRIPNATILSVRQVDRATTYEEDSSRVIAELAQYALSSGHRRPLLWSYNPRLLPAFAALPAVARLYHATENYFDFDHLLPAFVNNLRRSLSVADLVIAVSSGVEAAVRRNVPGARVAEVTNGCDFEEYSRATPAESLIRAGADYSRIAIYAGNLNVRMDFLILAAAADRYPEVLFALYGPVSGLLAEDQAAWSALLGRPNVRHFGPVEPSVLPGLYAAADVGLIPYKRAGYIENNGFPLKALEMVATGLPVVSTYMKPLLALSSIIRIAEDLPSFVEHIGATSRRTLGEAEKAEQRAVAKASDYDVRFSQMLDLVAALGLPAEPTTRIDALTAGEQIEDVFARLVQYGEPCSETVKRCLRTAGASAIIRTRRAFGRSS